MSEYAIRARFDADCEPAAVMDWLMSAEGIAGWWSDSVSGDASSPGDVFHVEFPTTDVVFDLEVVAMEGDSVAWHVPESPPWWQGTTIRFELSGGEPEGTSLLFIHEGFDPEDPIIEMITPAWVRFVDNPLEVARTGRANPAVIN